MQVWKSGGGCPLKKFGAKNMQNLVRFYTTLTLIAIIAVTSQDIQKSDRYVTKNDSWCVQWNKYGELWSTTQKVGQVSLD